MKGKHRRMISALLIALLLSTQLSMTAGAETGGQLNHVLDAEGDKKKGTGYATPDNADRNEPGEGDSEKLVLQWEFVDDDYLSEGQLPLIGVSQENQADFDTVVSMLPEKVRAEIEGADTAGQSYEEILTVIGWSSPEYRQDEAGQWPFTGEYEFTAKLPKGYVCEPPVSVMVTLEGAMVNTINDRFSADGLIYKELGPDTVQLMGYDGEKPTGTLIIPEKVIKPSNSREYQVVRIKEEAFTDCSGLTGDLLIPDTVTEIGANAFWGCNFTGELTLSNSLTRIEAGTFYQNSFTGELKLPDKLAYIGNFAFSDTGFTGRLVLPKELTYIGAGAFMECEFTGDLIIPDSVTYIGQLAFSDCEFTGELTLSKGLTEINREIFINCRFTGELKIPEGVTYIGLVAFKNCRFTGELILPDELKKIGDHAFYGCSGLTGRLRLPTSLTAIGIEAFSGTNFSGFDTTDQAVADLLRHSGVDKTMIQVGDQPYRPSVNRTITEGNMVYEILGKDRVKLISYSGNPGDDLFIPSAVADSAGNTYSVTHIGEDTFRSKGITGTLHLPNTLVCIEPYAFCNNEFAGSLSLPDSLTYIGDSAFASAAFTGDLIIPENVSYLGAMAFGFSGFTDDLIIKGKLTEIGPNVFYESGFTGALSLPDDVTFIDGYAFYGCGFTGSLDLPAGLTYIGAGAFNNCSGFTGALHIPEPVTEIDYFAFDGCSGLTSAHLGPNLEKLGRQAFPKSLPLFADSPQVQLLVNTYLDQDVIADTSWDGKEDVPDGAIATVKQDAVVTGDRRIGTEAIITVPEGILLTVDGSLIVDGTIYVNGTLVLNGSLSGSGIIFVGKNGRITGDTSGFRMEYPEDIEEAKKVIESFIYTVSQKTANDQAAVGDWLEKTIMVIPGLSHTGVAVREVKVTALTPAAEGTSGNPDGSDGNFTFTLRLSKGSSEEGAGGSGTITAESYVPNHTSSGGGHASSGRDPSAINPQILRGTWEQMEDGIWRFRQTNGVYVAGRWGMADNQWYYFDGEGRMLTGWQLINNQWYYLCTMEAAQLEAGRKEGAMLTGWYFCPMYQSWFYLDTNGTMLTGWKEIGGRWYYFYGNGVMAVNTKVDGYELGPDGAWKE